jgi:hypothetical protein
MLSSLDSFCAFFGFCIRRTDMPTTMAAKMIINNLETDSGVTCWSSYGDDSCDLQPEQIYLEL